MELTIIELGLAVIAAFVIGVSKAGVKGIFIITVGLMAYVFGGKASTGIVVPLLIFADLMAVKYYTRFARWKILFKFLPWMIAGVLVGVFVGKDIPEDLFLKIMVGIILFSLVLIIMTEQRNDLKLFNNGIFRSTMGFLAGLTTMLGNLAGGFSNVYFLSSRIPKTEFIATAAWLFMLINVFKLPFHIWVWETVNFSSLKYNLILLPAVVLGFIVGIKLVARFGESFFRKFILFTTALGALLILLR